MGALATVATGVASMLATATGADVMTVGSLLTTTTGVELMTVGSLLPITTYSPLGLASTTPPWWCP
jgi:hypothetical protein